MMKLAVIYVLYVVGSIVMNGFLYDVLRPELGSKLRNETNEEYEEDLRSFTIALNMMSSLWPITLTFALVFTAYSVLKSIISAK